MKQDRSVEMVRLASNLELMLGSDEEKFIAFTSDTAKASVESIVNELASIFVMKDKVAVLSYGDVDTHVDGVEYITVDGINDSPEDIKKKCENANITFVICPNMMESKSYLHMSEYTHELVVVARKWHSKTPNINTIKTLAEESGMKVLGLVYTK